MKSLLFSALALVLVVPAQAQAQAGDILAAYAIIRDSKPDLSVASGEGTKLLPPNLSVYDLDWSRCAERRGAEYGLVISGSLWGRWVDFSTRLTFQPCGTYRGRGQYLSGLHVVPVDASVYWPYNLNASVQVFEMAPLSTTKGPIARARVVVTATISNNFGKADTYSLIQVVQGDGKVELERTWTFDLKRPR